MQSLRPSLVLVVVGILLTYLLLLFVDASRWNTHHLMSPPPTPPSVIQGCQTCCRADFKFESSTFADGVTLKGDTGSQGSGSGLIEMLQVQLGFHRGGVDVKTSWLRPPSQNNPPQPVSLSGSSLAALVQQIGSRTVKMSMCPVSADAADPVGTQHTSHS